LLPTLGNFQSTSCDFLFPFSTFIAVFFCFSSKKHKTTPCLLTVAVISASRAAILIALEVVTVAVIKMATATLAVVAMAVAMVAVEEPLVVTACRTWALA
jgi:hypothetical protein